MSKHTPLPWNREAIYWLLRYGRKNFGCWSDLDIWPEDDPMSMPDENDTNLVGAAPQLLEACELALESDDPAVKDVLRAAIAKAKGE